MLKTWQKKLISPQLNFCKLTKENNSEEILIFKRDSENEITPVWQVLCSRTLIYIRKWEWELEILNTESNSSPMMPHHQNFFSSEISAITEIS